MNPVNDDPQPPVRPIIVLGFGVIAVSFSAIFIRLAQDEAPSLVIAAARLLIASLVLLPLALTRRRDELRSLTASQWRLAVLAGFALSIHFASWITSLEYTSITASTVLVTTTPLWVGLAAPFFLQEPLTRGLKVGIALALGGSLIISLDLSNSAAGSQPLLGNVLALTGAITAAIYLMIGRQLRLRLSLLSYVTVVYGVAALFLLVYMLAAGYSLAGYSPLTYLLFLLMALLPQLLGHSSYNWALAFLPAAYVSIATISEPIGASILAILLFQEIPGPVTLAGSALILAGIVVASRR